MTAFVLDNLAACGKGTVIPPCDAGRSGSASVGAHATSRAITISGPVLSYLFGDLARDCVLLMFECFSNFRKKEPVLSLPQRMFEKAM
jgi:hypothetical protein